MPDSEWLEENDDWILRCGQKKARVSAKIEVIEVFTMGIYRWLILVAGCLITVVFFIACASEETIKIGDDESRRIAGKRLAVTVGNPSLSVSAPGGAAMPLSDIAQMDSGNEQLVEVLKVEDPAAGVAKQLAKYLETQRAMVLEGKVNVDEKKTVESLVSRYGNLDYIMDVRTGIWDVRTISSYADKYFVAYTATIRLIDTEKKKVIAKGTCRRLNPESREALSLAQLRSDNGAKLKREIKELENYCAEAAKSEILP